MLNHFHLSGKENNEDIVRIQLAQDMDQWQ
jgi:hypothetical protein